MTFLPSISASKTAIGEICLPGDGRCLSSSRAPANQAVNQTGTNEKVGYRPLATRVLSPRHLTQARFRVNNSAGVLSVVAR